MSSPRLFRFFHDVDVSSLLNPFRPDYCGYLSSHVVNIAPTGFFVFCPGSLFFDALCIFLHFRPTARRKFSE